MAVAEATITFLSDRTTIDRCTASRGKHVDNRLRRTRARLFSAMETQDLGRDHAGGAAVLGSDRCLRSPALRRNVGINDHRAATDGVRSQCCGPVFRHRHADLLRHRRRTRAELSRLELRIHRRRHRCHRLCGARAEPEPVNCARRHHRSRSAVRPDCADRDVVWGWLGREAAAAGCHRRRGRCDRAQPCAGGGQGCERRHVRHLDRACDRSDYRRGRRCRAGPVAPPADHCRRHRRISFVLAVRERTRFRQTDRLRANSRPRRGSACPTSPRRASMPMQFS